MSNLLNEALFVGDAAYSIDCTGDAVVGDEICFERACFSGGSFGRSRWGRRSRPTFLGYELIKARIVSDSYGSKKQQHTFTLELLDGSRTFIKGRNLYSEGLWRKPWADEAAREAALDEKHGRGSAAREWREARLEAARSGRQPELVIRLVEKPGDQLTI